MQIPKPLGLTPILLLVCSKRSWSMAFDEQTMELSLAFIEDEEPFQASALSLEEIPKVTSFSSPH